MRENRTSGSVWGAPGNGRSYHRVFGALIAATDPITVVAKFRSFGAPRRLSMLLDGESLLNDGRVKSPTPSKRN